MDNQTLAKTWLQQDEDAQAAVYFGSDNKAWVQYSTGKTVPLLATPFADNMEKCLVYLDEAHTRGTDLKLPPRATGALTLGLNQTKDHTVQAAMRLRQLGTTQSITFIAPPEVHQSILDVRQKCTNDPLDSSDVIAWLLEQTCTSNRDLQPLYLAQGTDFCHRMQAATSYKHFLTNDDHRKAYMEVLQQLEQQTLEQLYEPQIQKSHDTISSPDAATLPLSGKLNAFMQELRQSYRQSHVSHGCITSSALEEVEQEREVAYEIEEEREVQRPCLMTALKFPGLHKSVLKFVNTGFLDSNSGCMKASTVLESTQLGLKHKIEASSLISHLYVSAEFTRTVRLKKGEKNDNYTRPVNWILWSTRTEDVLVIIPEEAEALIPIIRTTANPPVHLILYAAPFTKRMLHFNRLDYYSIPSLPEEWTPPPWLPFEVGILAGRLYFEFSEYSGLLDYFQFNSEILSGRGPAEDSNNTAQNKQSQTETLLSFLQEWLSVRRHGQDISHTPMGYMCQGLPLHSDHPFFWTRKASEQKNGDNGHLFSSVSYTARNENEEYYGSEEDEEAGVVEAGDDDESGDENGTN